MDELLTGEELDDFMPSMSLSSIEASWRLEGVISSEETEWLLEEEVPSLLAHIAAQERVIARMRAIERAAAVLARNVAEVPNHGATDYTVSPSLLMELRAALTHPAAREGAGDDR